MGKRAGQWRRFRALATLACLTIVAACGPSFPLGMSEQEWNALTPTQQFEARQQQAVINEERAARAAEERARKQELELQEQRQAVNSGAATPNSVGWDRFDGNRRIRTTSVKCESYDEATQRCGVGGRVEAARIATRHSRSGCRLGRDWGHGRDFVWVGRGCRATFEVALKRSNNRGPRVRCESHDGYYQTCDAGMPVESVTLSRKLSRSGCVEGESFGVSGGLVWVKNGCRAEFQTYLPE